MMQCADGSDQLQVRTNIVIIFMFDAGVKEFRWHDPKAADQQEEKRQELSELHSVAKVRIIYEYE